MDGLDLSPFALQRVDVYDGLAIDAATWTEAHGYHQTAQRLHVRALHGWGIVEGLTVTATDPPSRSVIVMPGLAVDGHGNVVRVPGPLRLDVKQTQPGTMCIVLRFAEAPAESGPDGGRPVRVAEAFQILECLPPLYPDDLELARVVVADARSPFRQAADPWAPVPGEIDRRFRRELRAQTVETVTVGRLALDGGGEPGLHRQGLINVLRELRPTAPFVLQFAGDVPPEAAGTCDLLYLTGAGELRITSHQGAHLQAYLRTGGVLFAEPCVEQETQQQENGRFVADLRQLLADLHYVLEEVQPGHQVFQARHIFGTTPQGMGGHAPLLCRGNVIVNPNDYGCYWQGGTAGKPLMREPIRSTMEFAANLAWYAAAAARLRA